MIITREEFKELVTLYKEAYEKAKELENYLSEKLMLDLLFNHLEWISKKLGICFEDFDLINDIVTWGNAPISWNEDGVVTDLSDDLDEIYDKYLDNVSYEKIERS